ncbi:MAG: marine proteobacterial sortase target protein [Cellvibrionaceae bacterium]
MPSFISMLYKQTPSLRTFALNSLVVLLTLTGHSIEASANEEVKSGEFRLKPIVQGNVENTQREKYEAAILEKTDVKIDVSGIIARVIVKQHFKNNSKHWSEGEYVFPLPTNSAVDYMAMHIGERKIVGTVKEKQIAKKLYEQAKSAGKKASLVSQQRPNLFTNKVANIAPGESITIELHYVETLRYDQGIFSLRVPTTITPRYIPGHAFAHINNFDDIEIAAEEKIKIQNENIKDAYEITPPMTASSNASVLTLTATIDSGTELQEIKSIYHNFEQKQFGNIYSITIDPTAKSNKDVVIEWTPKIGKAPIAASFKETIDDDEYILLMVMPPQNIQKESILPKETIFIIDTSGSMAGKSITQAKKALIASLDYLSPTDRFNIIEFNSSHRSLFKNPVSVDSNNINSANQFISGLNANGGTEMAGALKEAFSNKSKEGFVRQIIFITDGSVGNEDSLFNLIENNKGRSRLYTVGIGSAPNSYFMERAAESGQGTFTYISTQSDINKGMSDLFYKLKSPIMTDIKINFKSLNADIYPKHTPDLYAGEPLIISSKISDSSIKNRTVAIEGKLNNTLFHQNIQVSSNKESEAVSKLWARNKLKDLYHNERKAGRSNTDEKNKEQIKQDITRLAIQHQLLSKYTSFLAIEEVISRPKNTLLSKNKIPNAMPEGSTQAIPQNTSQTIAMPSGGLGILSLWYIVITCLLGLLAMHYRYFTNKIFYR